jgi:hypothetical protein
MWARSANRAHGSCSTHNINDKRGGASTTGDYNDYNFNISSQAGQRMALSSLPAAIPTGLWISPRANLAANPCLSHEAFVRKAYIGK